MLKCHKRGVQILPYFVLMMMLLKSPKQDIRMTDLETWQAFLKGDVVAFDSLMSTHYRGLFQYGAKFSSDFNFIKDTIQDLFLYLWENRTRLAQDVSVKAYLMASLRRRMHRYKNSDFLDVSILTESRLFDFELSVETAFIEQETTLHLSQQLKDGIALLPKRQKEIIYLRFYQNLDREQIAEVLNITPQTVSNILQMAFKNMRKNWMDRLWVLLFLLCQGF
jgi:RNA polymerase sigma factor (sigma-70 family)